MSSRRSRTHSTCRARGEGRRHTRDHSHLANHARPRLGATATGGRRPRTNPSQTPEGERVAGRQPIRMTIRPCPSNSGALLVSAAERAGGGLATRSLQLTGDVPPPALGRPRTCLPAPAPARGSRHPALPSRLLALNPTAAGSRRNTGESAPASPPAPDAAVDSLAPPAPSGSRCAYPLETGSAAPA